MANNDRRTQQGRQPPPRNEQQQPPPAQQRPPSRIEDVRGLVRKRMAPSVRMLLAGRPNDELERFTKVFLNALEAKPELLECSDGSIGRALLHAAEVDLLPGGPYPHAWLISYWNDKAKRHELQFQISVWGYVELIRRSGGVRKVWADVIYSNDKYKLISGTAGKSIEHEPQWFAKRADRGHLVGSYACALLENGETVCEPVSAEDLELARAQNRGKSPAWDLWPDQQRQKVALKRLQKYLPKGPAERGLEIDEDPGGSPRGILDVEGVPVDLPEDAPPQGALDRAVEQHKAEQATSNQSTTLDREALFSMLCDADERYKTRRAMVDGWDEIEALSVLAFLRTMMTGVGEGETPPEIPACMRIPRDAA